jgi:hypothetical protein
MVPPPTTTMSVELAAAATNRDDDDGPPRNWRIVYTNTMVVWSLSVGNADDGESERW